MILVDEAGFCKFSLMTDVLIPQMIDKHTATIMITTPKDPEDPFSQMVSTIDPRTQKPVLNLVQLGQPCDACQKGSQPWLCTHFDQSVRPSHKSTAKQGRFNALYAGLEDINMREQWGMVVGSVKRGFTDKGIRLLRENERAVCVEGTEPHVLWVFGDPCDAGTADFGLVAAYFVNGAQSMVIAGLDACPLMNASPDEERARMVGFVRRLREHRWYAHARIVCAFEAAPKMTAAHLASYVREYDPTITIMREMRSGSGGRTTPHVGVPKTSDSTHLSRIHLQSLLVTGGVYFSAELASVTSTPGEAVTKLLGQLATYRFDAEKNKWHGKFAGKNDDLVVALMSLVYWRVQFWASDSPDYDDVKRHVRARTSSRRAHMVT